MRKQLWNNEEVRQAIRDANVYYYEVAAEIPLSDTNFSKMLRQELKGDDKKRVLHAIDKAHNKKYK